MSMSLVELKAQDIQSPFTLKHHEALSLLTIMSLIIFKQLSLSDSFVSIETCKSYLSCFCSILEKPQCKTAHYYQSSKVMIKY